MCPLSCRFTYFAVAYGASVVASLSRCCCLWGFRSHPPHRSAPHLTQCLALFAVSERWLLFDIWWFVLLSYRSLFSVFPLSCRFSCHIFQYFHCHVFFFMFAFIRFLLYRCHILSFLYRRLWWSFHNFFSFYLIHHEPLASHRPIVIKSLNKFKN